MIVPFHASTQYLKEIIIFKKKYSMLLCSNPKFYTQEIVSKNKLKNKIAHDTGRFLWYSELGNRNEIN